MPKSKNRTNHKQKLEQFKQKRRTMSQQIPQMPPVRNVPVWDPNARIEVTGYEWEAIQNGLTNVQMALQAAQSVMSRNILNGTITMDFEKLNSATLQYEPMTAEESAPHVEEFQKQVDAFKTAQSQALAPQADAAQEVSDTTTPVATEATPKKASKRTKVVDMNGKEVAKS